jgi:hypothetical protein
MTSVLATGAYLRRVVLSGRLPWKRIAGLTAVLLALNALWSGVYIIKLPAEYNASNGYQLIQFLEKNHLAYGYATYYNANGPTVYAGEKVCIRPIRLESGQVTPMNYLSNNNWYNKPLDSCFLLLTYSELEHYGDVVPKDYISVLNYGDDKLFIYDHNIFD